MPTDHGSRIGNRRTRRAWKRMVCAVVAIAAIVGGIGAARVWRREQQEESARIQGLAAFERGEWDLALRELGLLVGRATEDREVLLAFAAARLQVPLAREVHVSTAIFAIDRAEEFGADTTQCARLRLRAYVAGGMLAEAQREAERVLAIDERDREARRVYVHACCARGRLDDAEQVLRRAVKLEPSSLSNRIALTEILVKRAREAALDQSPNRGASNTLLDEVASWAREPHAPSGVSELVHAAALDIAPDSRELLATRIAGPERVAETIEEVELRTRLLDEVGRSSDGSALLTQFLQSKAPKSDERFEVARTLFRRAIFSSDFGRARELHATEFADLQGDQCADLCVVYRTVIALVEGGELDLHAGDVAWDTASPKVRAWLLEVQSLREEKGMRTSSDAEVVDVVAEAALRFAEARRAAQSGDWSDALRRANDAVQLARGRFDAAEMVAIESLHELGQCDEAFARSARLVDVSSGQPRARALRLLSETKLSASEGLQPMRPPELRIADARAILISDDATLRDLTIATLVLGSLTNAEEARSSFARCVARAQWQDSECVALSESVVILARALNDMSYLSIGRDVITHKVGVATEDSRWAIAWIDALAAEREGDVARAWSMLCAAAPTKRARLAIIGEFGDRHGIEAALSMLRSSLPEGAAIVSGTRAVMHDPQLAVDTFTALKGSGDARAIAFNGLRFATAHPSHFDAEKVLSLAADARRLAARNPSQDRSRDVELLAAIAGFLLSTSPPDPAQALLLLDDAIRLVPADQKLHEHAGYAALLAGDPQRAQEHADALSSEDARTVFLRVQIAIAQGDGKRAEFELARLHGDEHEFPRFAIGDVPSLRTLAAILQGHFEHVRLNRLPMEAVRIARMIPAEQHRALVLHCARSETNPVLVAHLAAEYLHRQTHGEIAAMAQSIATKLLEQRDQACTIAAYRAAVACGDNALSQRALETLRASASPRGLLALQREKAVALLVSDPAESYEIARKILEQFPDDPESMLIALTSAVALRNASANDAALLARLPKSPESHLVEARMALLAGRDADARRAARLGIELAARRAYVAFDTRASLHAMSEATAVDVREIEGKVAEARVARTGE